MIPDNFLWQYLIVAIIIIAAIVKIIYNIRTANRRKRGSCAGCSLASACNEFSSPKNNKRSNPSNSQDGEKDSIFPEEQENKRECHK